MLLLLVVAPGVPSRVYLRSRVSIRFLQCGPNSSIVCYPWTGFSSFPIFEFAAMFRLSWYGMDIDESLTASSPSATFLNFQASKKKCRLSVFVFFNYYYYVLV